MVPNTKTQIFDMQKAVHSSVCIDSPAVALFLSHSFCFWLPETTGNQWELGSTNNDCEELTY